MGSGSGDGSGVDDIPQEILDLLPADPFEMLKISRSIAVRAMSAHAQQAERDSSNARSNYEASQGSMKSLEEKVSSLEASLREAMDKVDKSEQEQARLSNEKTALVAMVKKLNRDVAKLETFKRTLMQQLQDENDDEPPSMVAAAAAAPKPAASEPVSASAGSGASAAKQQAADGASDADSYAGDKVKLANQTPPPAAAAETTPRAINPPPPIVVPSSNSSSNSKLRTPLLTPSLVSPQYTPSATPPHSASGAASREGRPPRVDGKEFFRQARNRLSYEQFSAFLANIKELNAHRQSREETLRKADEIFGPDNKDLYTAFDGLLSRHLPS
ncbi:hypothetical protein CLOM_g2525 [Closterium sp. NIES-68]|nr:hypothetical protein CLOM_g2525 [Closterium sp. NIES-68]GJP74275.1 hypothetical protein CLOP_g4884 [Closterium sp. NIES-67]